MTRPIPVFSRIPLGLAWLFAWVPGLGVLALAAVERVPLPYHDSWAFVRQYQAWVQGHYTWRDLLALHNNHPAAVGKLCYFAVLQWCRGDVGLLPLVTWALSLVISLGVVLLTRPLWKGRPMLGAGWALLTNLSVFSLAAGHTWIWDFLFQNFVPGACLVLGLLVIRDAPMTFAKWLGLIVCSLLATFSFGSGFLVGLLLVPSIWLALADRPLLYRVLSVSGWCIVVFIVAWLALRVFSKSEANNGAEGRVQDLIETPLMTLQFILILLGQSLGQGTPVDPEFLSTIVGAVLVLLALAAVVRLLLRGEAARWRAAWPGAVFFTWAVLNACLICLGRMRHAVQGALALRYITFTLFAVVGVLLLMGAAWGRGDRDLASDTSEGADPNPTSAPWRFLWQGILVGLLLTLQAVNWIAGAHELQLFSRHMLQEKAAIAVGPVVRGDESLLWYLSDSVNALSGAQFLASQKRLRGVTFLTSADISALHVSGRMSFKWSHWQLFPQPDGQSWLIRGVCGLSKEQYATADLILLTAQAGDAPEKIFAVAAPSLPPDFFDSGARRRAFADHYFGWSHVIQKSALPAAPQVKIHAYALESEARRARPFEDEATVVTQASP